MIDAIATRMTELNLVGGATGWSVYKGIMPDDPDTIVSIFLLPGGLRDRTQGAAADLRPYSVKVRGAAYGYEVARTKAEDIFQTMNDEAVTGLVLNLAASSVEGAGYDQNARPVFSMTFNALESP